MRVATLRSRVDDVEAVAADNDLLVVDGRENSMTAFSLEDGRVLWSRRDTRLLSAPVLLIHVPTGAPALADRRVFVNAFGPNRYEFQALDAPTGNLVWIARDGSFSAPSGADGRIVAAGRESVLAIDRNTGEIVGRIGPYREITTSPVSAGDLVLFGTIDGALHAARLKS